jgi:hypothetical protein
MFAFADYTYNGPIATAAHFLMSATLTQVCLCGWLGWWLAGLVGVLAPRVFATVPVPGCSRQFEHTEQGGGQEGGREL